VPTVIVTPGAADANSYCTVAEADTYHSLRLHSETWTAATATIKETAVIMATRCLDFMYEWAEYSTSADQALMWPRIGLLSANQLEYIDEYEIPPELKNATAEYARQLIDVDRTTDQQPTLSSLTAGPISLAFTNFVPTAVVPDAVINMIPSWWGWARGTGRNRELLRA